MNKAPVFFTVCQVHHNPLLSLDSYLPAIQESMRKCGYPDFRRVANLTFGLTAGLTPEGAAIQAPPVQKTDQFQFSNSENTSGFVLVPTGLSFQTTAYETFELFSKEMRRGLEILHEAVGGLSFVERLGLRYLDAVVPKAGESIAEYLAPQLLGLPSTMIDNRFSYSFAEAMLQADQIQVISRTIIQNSPLMLPPDLQTSPVKVVERFRSVMGEHAVLDTDGSLTQRRPFDLDEHQRSLDAIHDLVAKVFRAITTDGARAAWHEQGVN
jgi:uncharacterized protein (TIGR04255 family)